MGQKRALRLEGSNEALRFPNGYISIEVLEKMLYNAVDRGIDRQKLVLVAHHERVANFNPNNPKWKDTGYRVPLKELFRMYEDITGREYMKPNFEEMERDAERKAARQLLR
jgi:hypothetical protein